MKYMGSKRLMLRNGLGDLIIDSSRTTKRIIDLFCGAGFVSWFAAENTNLPVVAVDLQNYAVVLAKSIVERTKGLDSASIKANWIERAISYRDKSVRWAEAQNVESRNSKDVRNYVIDSRLLCKSSSPAGPIWSAYGGYYYSPSQALTFDYLLKYLPEKDPEYTVCLASIITSASMCAASPGHTAQPFQPTKTAGTFIKEAWKRNPIDYCVKALKDLAERHANAIGKAVVGNAVEFAQSLKPTDLVFVDPPYTDVHYSRFYHVLETIARRQRYTVEGSGRYPPIEERPQSEFSKKSQSRKALEKLLSTLAGVGSTVIVTFPEGDRSNGLSGKLVTETAKRWFCVKSESVYTNFSTLGGNNVKRDCRKGSNELMLLLKPLQ